MLSLASPLEAELVLNAAAHMTALIESFITRGI